MHPILYYAHDPMCSWCWAFRSTWEQVLRGWPDGVQARNLLGGLAPDSDKPMPLDLQRHLQDTWRRIEQRVPGVRFDFEFWKRCRPRRSTYPACRAVIAARRQAADGEGAMILAIQRAYYTQARNPSEVSTLVELAEELGLDPVRFRRDLEAPDTHAELAAEIAQARSMGLSSFPSLALEIGTTRWSVPVSYTDPGEVLVHIRMLLG